MNKWLLKKNLLQLRKENLNSPMSTKMNFIIKSLFYKDNSGFRQNRQINITKLLRKKSCESYRSSGMQGNTPHQ